MHFSGLIVRPHSGNRRSRFWMALSLSALPLLKTVKSSLMWSTPFSPAMVSSIALSKMSCAEIVP